MPESASPSSSQPLNFLLSGCLLLPHPIERGDWDSAPRQCGSLRDQRWAFRMSSWDWGMFTEHLSARRYESLLQTFSIYFSVHDKSVRQVIRLLHGWGDREVNWLAQSHTARKRQSSRHRFPESSVALCPPPTATHPTISHKAEPTFQRWWRPKGVSKGQAGQKVICIHEQ